MELNFSFRKPKEQQVEKYPNIPVLTYLGSSGVSKFKLNQKALELLGYNEQQITGKMVSFGPLGDTLFIANTTGVDGKAKKITQANLNLSNDFNSGKLLERLQKTFKFDVYEGMEFILECGVEKADYPYLIVTMGQPNEDKQMSRSDIIDSSNKAFDDEIGEIEVLNHQEATLVESF